jgi:hypothetical protein
MSKHTKLIGYAVWGVEDFWNRCLLTLAKFGLLGFAISLATIVYLLLKGRIQ